MWHPIIPSHSDGQHECVWVLLVVSNQLDLRAENKKKGYVANNCISHCRLNITFLFFGLSLSPSSLYCFLFCSLNPYNQSIVLYYYNFTMRRAGPRAYFLYYRCRRSLLLVVLHYPTLCTALCNIPSMNNSLSAIISLQRPHHSYPPDASAYARNGPHLHKFTSMLYNN